VNPKDLDKDSFWVKVHEDQLASEDLFSELKQNFSSKTVSKYTTHTTHTSCSFAVCGKTVFVYILPASLLNEIVSCADVPLGCYSPTFTS